MDLTKFEALEKRVQELEEQRTEQEIQMAYQVETIEALETNMAQQYQEIQSLKHQITLLSDVLKSLKQHWQDSGIRPLSEEIPPPHY